MTARAVLSTVAMLLSSVVLAQPAPPPESTARTQTLPPGLSAELAEATAMMREGQYVTALARIDEVLAKDARNPQARFLKGVVQTDQGDVDEAAGTFQALTEDFPELPEPHNNLAVIWAQLGRYDKAKIELELALAAHPDYAIAHENLGDVYTRLAGSEYDRALALDKTNKSAQAKLTLVRQLFAVPPSAAPTKVAVPKPATPKQAQPVRSVK
jgi:tetratricopeptide (TPR) repeat protein